MGFARIGFTLLATMLLGACVTINIYFPAAAAEKAADKIIDEVWQLKKENEGGGLKTPAEETGK
jgi:hypothetical protein